MKDEVLLFCGSSHRALGEEISQETGILLGNISLSKFPDGEIAVEVLEDVRGRDVYILQSIAIDPDFYLMELLIIIDAVKRSSARKIIPIIPYFGYCRQDRKDKPGVPITAKLVANVLSIAGATRLISLDLHSSQVEGFFEIPVDHLHAQELLANAIKKMFGEPCIVVAPDIGSVKVAKRMAELLKADLAVIEKQRVTPFEVKMTLIGDVANKNVLIADDMCSTAGTIVAAADLCKTLSAKKIIAAVTHGLCVGDALEKIEKSALERLLITNSIPETKTASKCSKIAVVSVAELITNCISSCG